MTTISQQVRELETLSTAELADRYEALHGRPPRVRNRAFLRRRVAWKLQEREFGGLSDRAKARLEELIAEVDLPLGLTKNRHPRPPARSTPRAPRVGTSLVRKWHDQEVRVEVRENGYEWDGILYRSLSAVAKAITGSNWNGRLFFGLSKRKTAQ